MIIYGDSGVGKTYLAATADQSDFGRPALLIDVEAGKKTVQHMDIDVVTIGEVADSSHVTGWTVLLSIVNSLLEGKLSKYKTIILDSLTDAYQMALLDVVMSASLLKPEEVDPDLPQLQHYLVAGNRIKRLVRDLRNLPRNTIFTALAAVVQDERTQKKSVGPFLTDRLSSQMPAYVDNVAYLYVTSADPEKPAGDNNPLKRILLTSPSGKYTAKDRGGKLGGYLENPDMNMIFRLLFDLSSPQLEAKETEAASDIV